MPLLRRRRSGTTPEGWRVRLNGDHQPRTARFELPDNTALRPLIGVDVDTTKLFLCTVNGRQELSLGMSFQEMADVLMSIEA